jgi:hypothetical protein
MVCVPQLFSLPASFLVALRPQIRILLLHVIVWLRRAEYDEGLWMRDMRQVVTGDLGSFGDVCVCGQYVGQTRDCGGRSRGPRQFHLGEQHVSISLVVVLYSTVHTFAPLQ